MSTQIWKSFAPPGGFFDDPLDRHFADPWDQELATSGQGFWRPPGATQAAVLRLEKEGA